MAEILLGNIKGPKGVTFTPSVDSSGNLSWSNDGGLANPATVNIKGPKGDQGAAGEGGGGGLGDAIPKTGNRGALAGFNDCNATLVVSDTTITIDENSPDDMMISVGAGTLTLHFASSSTSAYIKNIFLMNQGGTVNATFGDSAFVDTFFSSYVNDLGLSTMNQVVVTSYYSSDAGNMVVISNKVLL